MAAEVPLVALGALTDATDERLDRALAPGAVRGCVEVLLKLSVVPDSSLR